MGHDRHLDNVGSWSGPGRVIHSERSAIPLCETMSHIENIDSDVISMQGVKIGYGVKIG